MASCHALRARGQFKLTRSSGLNRVRSSSGYVISTGNCSQRRISKMSSGITWRSGHFTIAPFMALALCPASESPCTATRCGVEPGLALDCLGREVDLRHQVYLGLRYTEQPISPVPTPDGSSEPSRIQEGFELVWVDELIHRSVIHLEGQHRSLGAPSTSLVGCQSWILQCPRPCARVPPAAHPGLPGAAPELTHYRRPRFRLPNRRQPGASAAAGAAQVPVSEW
jgi:hypothetical protein